MQEEKHDFSNHLVDLNTFYFFFNSRKAVQPKTKANNRALHTGYPQ